MPKWLVKFIIGILKVVISILEDWLKNGKDVSHDEVVRQGHRFLSKFMVDVESLCMEAKRDMLE